MTSHNSGDVTDGAELLRVVLLIHRSVSLRGICERFGLSKSTVSTIWKIEALFQMHMKMVLQLQKGFACVRKPTLMKHCCNGFEGKVKLEP
ncbi:hypothetical protein T07_7491 [Trichinella nelsoni]|uniref:Transposase Helix-turn-helix domain-containing protein n=1 Tax=Trichinella nelsoni TaxID=6336 RepID=A0A0V0RVI9_9BILA|nr:hypothetical protein T07_7491 [Trichinella nelsoni]